MNENNLNNNVTPQPMPNPVPEQPVNPQPMPGPVQQPVAEPMSQEVVQPQPMPNPVPQEPVNPQQVNMDMGGQVPNQMPGEPQPMNTEIPQQPAAPMAPEKPPKQKSNPVLIFLMIIALIGGAIYFGYNYFFANKTTTTKTTNSGTTDNTNEEVTNSETDNDTNNQNVVSQYKGTDPWGEDLVVTIKSTKENKVEWVISNKYYEEEISSELNNKTASFSIKGTSKDGQNEFNYTGLLTLNDDSVSIKYESGQCTSISSSGGGGFMMASALEENAKTVSLKKES